MSKYYKIKECSECPKFWRETSECLLMKNTNTQYKIPPWCPLPDLKEK